MYKSKFKLFGGGYIPDIVEYLRLQIERDPNITITVGCDSIQRRRRTSYAITLMVYNSDLRHGAHIVFFRESVDKIRDNYARLHKEAQYAFDVAEYLHNELSKIGYERKDLTTVERKKYKYHLLKCAGEYKSVPLHQDDVVMNNLTLTDADKAFDFKLVDIHIDFNPFDGTVNERGTTNNRSSVSYRSYVPWLRGMGFRTWAKSSAAAATYAADLLLQD